MVYRRKNHKDRIVPRDWVIGGVCIETKESFMCHVGNRIADELYEGYKDWINPQSHIVTDCWRAYPEVARRLQASSHQTVNHSSNFVDPKTGAHAQTASKASGPYSSAGYTYATASPEAGKCSISTWASSYGDKSTRTKIPSKHHSRPSGDARMLGRQRLEILTSSIIKLLSNPTSCSYEVTSENAVQWCVPCLPSSAASRSDVCLCGFQPRHRQSLPGKPSAKTSWSLATDTPQFSGLTSASVGSSHVIDRVFLGHHRRKPLGAWCYSAASRCRCSSSAGSSHVIDRVLP